MEILATHLPNTRGPIEVQRTEFDALLQRGRILAGVVSEVTPSEALLRVGQYTFSAKSHPGLVAGQQLLLKATGDNGAGGVLLKILGGPATTESGLLRQLRAVLSADRPLGELLQQLARKLTGIESSQKGTTAGFGDQLAAHVFRPGASGSELMQLLLRGGLNYEALLLKAGGPAGSRADAKSLLLDLKAKLLSQLSKLSEGPARDVVARALSGLEAEQLLNVARHEAGEPLHWSFPMLDGENWMTAHLLWTENQAEHESAEDGDGEYQRISLGINFSKTGPVRVDAWMRSDRLNLRVLVEREPVAAVIRASTETLIKALGQSDRTVHIVVGVAPAEEVEIEARTMDIHYLRENHLMDVSG